MTSISAICVVAALVVVAAAPEQTPELTLGQRNAAIAEPFSDIVGFAELKDGRVMITDRVERALILADFRTGDRKTIGTNGAGPTEYANPFGPVLWRGDTLLVFDSSNRRYLKVTSGGVPMGTVAWPTKQIAGSTGWSAATAADARGHVYWDSPILQMQPTVKRLTTARIIRWMPGTDSSEVAGEFGDHAESEDRFRYRAYSQTDAWVLGGDGRIGVLSAAEYRLRWYKDGKLDETGPIVPYTRVQVGAAEREAFWRQKAMEPMSGASPNGAPMSRPPTMGIERARAGWGDTLFPQFLPPFELRGVLRAPNGNIWVKRTAAASERAPRIDVLDAHGALKGVVRLAPKSRLLALGVSSVYVIAVDEDGLQTVERYAMPATLR